MNNQIFTFTETHGSFDGVYVDCDMKFEVVKFCNINRFGTFSTKVESVKNRVYEMIDDMMAYDGKVDMHVLTMRSIYSIAQDNDLRVLNIAPMDIVKELNFMLLGWDGCANEYTCTLKFTAHSH